MSGINFSHFMAIDIESKIMNTNVKFNALNYP